MSYKSRHLKVFSNYFDMYSAMARSCRRDSSVVHVVNNSIEDHFFGLWHEDVYITILCEADAAALEHDDGKFDSIFIEHDREENPDIMVWVRKYMKSLRVYDEDRHKEFLEWKKENGFKSFEGETI